MIVRDCTILLKSDSATLSETLVLYKGDQNIEYTFTLKDNAYKFSNGTDGNIVTQLEASYAQILWYKNAEIRITFPIQATNDGKVVLKITKELIDEDNEMGDYDFQIRLYDSNKEAILTLPPLLKAVHIKAPLFEKDPLVDLASADVSTLVTAGPEETIYGTDGNYLKTTWVPGMIITSAKLNKIETALYDACRTKTAGDISLTDTSGNFTSDNVEGALSEINSQIKEIANVGKPTDKQVQDAINQAIANGDIVAGGLTSTAQTLLISILKNAVFTSDQSTSIALLQSELAKGNSGGSSETTQYAISNNLANATTSNSTVLVNANDSYSATITVNGGYELSAITVTMGDTDITSTAVSGTTITISAVTGNVVITVTTTQSSSGGGSTGGEMVTDGLENYFDFRNAKYNNAGSGGSTIITATQGNGSLFTWTTDAVTEQGEYGVAVKRSLIYNGTSVGTTDTSLGTSFTIIFKCYLTNLASPFFDNGYGVLSNISKLKYKPKYKTSSSTSNITGVGLGTRLNSAYDTLTLMVDGNICKLYFGTELMQTNDGSTIEDFQGWYDKLSGINILGGIGHGYLTQLAIYNKALSEVELVDMLDYLTTLEVK